MSNNESKVQDWAQKWLKERLGNRLYIFKVPISQYGSRRGIPDLIMSIDGKFIGIEVKADASCKPTELQKFEITKINLSGGHAFVLYGKDEASLQSIIDGLSYETV